VLLWLASSSRVSTHERHTVRPTILATPTGEYSETCSIVLCFPLRPDAPEVILASYLQAPLARDIFARMQIANNISIFLLEYTDNRNKTPTCSLETVLRRIASAYSRVRHDFAGFFLWMANFMPLDIICI
jgi:hypothetical protein